MKNRPTIDEAKFLASPSIVLNVLGQPVEAKPRKFKTGSLGYYASGKVTTTIDGVVVKLQVGSNITVCGSKPEEAGE
jgi:hypothetical protein